MFRNLYKECIADSLDNFQKFLTVQHNFFLATQQTYKMLFFVYGCKCSKMKNYSIQLKKDNSRDYL